MVETILDHVELVRVRRVACNKEMLLMSPLAEKQTKKRVFVTDENVLNMCKVISIGLEEWQFTYPANIQALHHYPAWLIKGHILRDQLQFWGKNYYFSFKLCKTILYYGIWKRKQFKFWGLFLSATRLQRHFFHEEYIT